MLFLVFFGLIAIIVTALNIYDNSNLNSIENYLQNKKCQEIVYSKGSYKGLCEEGLYIIPNSFSLDIPNDEKRVNYHEISSVKTDKQHLIIQTSQEKITVEFQDENNLNRYLQQLQDRD